MRNNVEKVIVHAWEWLYLRGVFPALQNKAVIFMLHRMEAPDTLYGGHSAEFLDQALNYLSRKGYNFVSLEDIFKNIKEGGPLLKKAIAFTIDDGFIDQARIAAPIFIKYKCPVTVFLITGFVDGGPPPWDAFVKYIFYKTNKRQITVKLNSETLTYNIDGPEERYNSMNEFRNKCKSLSEAELKKAVDFLLTESGLENIKLPISSAQALSWDDARKLEKSDVSFSPHTINHVILSNYSDSRAREEIKGSWDKLIQNLERPCPVFAYPTGRKKDFSIRDINYIKEIELLGAVMAEPGYVDFDDITEADKYLIKRMSFPSSLEKLIQYSAGLEYVKLKVRALAQNYKYVGKTKMLFYLMSKVKFHLGFFNSYANIDWKKVSRIVFVCKGNICRSPYAEMRAKQLGINASSIGLHTKEGSAANEGALKNAFYRNINLDAHRARIYESIEFSNSDLVICMEPWHVKLFKEVDSSDCQVTLLGLWCSQKKIIVSDPYGKPDIFFDDCFHMIDDALNNIKNLFKHEKNHRAA